MAKNTTPASKAPAATTTNGASAAPTTDAIKSNGPEITSEALYKAVHAETAGRERMDFNGNRRRSIALQLALAYPETLGTWRNLSILWHGNDKANRAKTRDWAAAALDIVDMDDTAKRNNMVAALMGSVTFACDMISHGFQDDIVLGASVTFIRGGSRLCNNVWRVLEWTNNKKLSGKRSADMDLPLVLKGSDKDSGHSLSWSQLSDVIRDIAGRKTQGRSKAVSVSAAKPHEALKVISNIASNAEASQFASEGSRILSIDTAEDVLALAISGEAFIALDKEFASLFERARGMVRTMAASGIASAKGDPDTAAKVAATLAA